MIAAGGAELDAEPRSSRVGELFCMNAGTEAILFAGLQNLPRLGR